MKAIAPVIVCVLALAFIWGLDKCKPKTDSTPQLTVEDSTQTQSEGTDTVFVDRVDTLVLYKTKYVQKWNFDNPNFIVQHDTVYKDIPNPRLFIHDLGDSIVLRDYDSLVSPHHTIPTVERLISLDSVLTLKTFRGQDTTETYTMSWEMGIHGDLIYFEPVISVRPTEKKCRFWDLFKRKK
jgi:hypothetical protein